MEERRIKSIYKPVADEESEFFKHGGDPFDKVFPDIEDIVIEVEEHSPDIEQDKRIRVYHKSNIRDFIGCQNPRCQGGGFFVFDIVHEMRGDRKTKLSTWKACIGNESAEGTSNTVQYCINSFNIKVRIKYKNNITWPFAQ